MKEGGGARPAGARAPSLHRRPPAKISRSSTGQRGTILARALELARFLVPISADGMGMGGGAPFLILAYFPLLVVIGKDETLKK